MNMAVKCPVCAIDAKKLSNTTVLPLFEFFDCANCGRLGIYHSPEEFQNGVSANGADLFQIAALLCERRLAGVSGYIILETGQKPDENNIPQGYIVYTIRDLNSDWPRTVPERINRAFCNLVRYAQLKGIGPGRIVQLNRNPQNCILVFASNNEEAHYYFDAMDKYGWVEQPTSNLGSWGLRITPSGWAQFDELDRTARNRENPVFVAMWFGKKKKDDGTEIDRASEMKSLFEGAIKSACEAAGWNRVIRAGTDEHNEPIMDRVIADLRIAPFVIADLTENNPGVYFEAGWARGLGTDVIYCCPKGTTPHFDVSGINLVKYEDGDDLRKRLENRILGTVGRFDSKQGRILS
ncbi:MAG: hypothetical protein AABZ47_05045 [Planctomycetota bacterium]|mgnify:CR=1 FL=1